jgi:hypothetical protein
MNFRFVMIIGEGSEEVLLIRLADGSEQRLPYQTVIGGNFTL